MKKPEITVVIPTHAIKVEKIGPYKNHPQTNRTAPNTHLIEAAVRSVLSALEVPLNLNFLVSVDHKTDNPLSVAYLDNLCNLQDRFQKSGYAPMRVMSSNSKLEDNVLTTVTATNNFMNAIDMVHTEFFMLWEHDWIFRESLHVGPRMDRYVDLLKNTRSAMLRFNQRENKSYENHETVWTDDTNFLRTNLYSNNPFIVRKKVWDEHWKPLAYPIPDWWGEHGAFIEGPINEKIKNKNTDILDKCAIYLFGNMNEEASVQHLNGQTWTE